jgi:hypothetical protein
MRLVFIAGPYRADTEWQITSNVRRAEAAALEVWNLGAAVICPHKNTERFGGAAPDEVWLKGGQEMVRRCDAVYAISGWGESRGAKAEVGLARQSGIPVLFSIEELAHWLSRT